MICCDHLLYLLFRVWFLICFHVCNQRIGLASGQAENRQAVFHVFPSLLSQGVSYVSFCSSIFARQLSASILLEFLRGKLTTSYWASELLSLFHSFVQTGLLSCFACKTFHLHNSISNSEQAHVCVQHLKRFGTCTSDYLWISG